MHIHTSMIDNISKDISKAFTSGFDEMINDIIREPGSKIHGFPKELYINVIQY